MKKLSAIAVALTLLGSSAAHAQYNNSPDRDRGVTGQQTEPQNRNNNSQEQGRNDNQQGRNEVRDSPRWSRGDKLSSEYRGNQYVVSDWKSNHLRQPPRGYHWVRANNQYVLAAVATGIIADIIMMSNQRDDQRTR